MLTIGLVPRLRDDSALKMILHKAVRNVQNGDGQWKMENGKLKMKNTKHYAQRLSKVSEWPSKVIIKYYLCLCDLYVVVVLFSLFPPRPGNPPAVPEGAEERNSGNREILCHGNSRLFSGGT